MARTKKQPDLPDLKTDWAFRARFRARAFGWKGSKLAIERLKQALTEISASLRTEAAGWLYGFVGPPRT